MRITRNAVSLLLLSIGAAACSPSGDHYAGYIEGEYTYISSGVTGTLFNLFVTRGQSVSKGAQLYALDPEPEASAVKEEKAAIADLQAQVDYAKVHLARLQDLLQYKASTKDDVDAANQVYQSKSQQLEADTAQLAQNEWSLQQKTQYANANGIIFDTFYRIGEKVEANHPVVAMLTPDNIRVLFYIPEALLSQVKLGKKVVFNCDGCKQTEANISYISPEAEYTPPVIYSKDTRNKLVYLIRADMPADVAIQFHPGQPIDVTLVHE